LSRIFVAKSHDGVLIGAEFLLVGLAEAWHFSAEAHRTEADIPGNKNPSEDPGKTFKTVPRRGYRI
jgi:hypothetical protein